MFGDVHGNAFALEAVARDIEASSPDAVVNLGDQLFGGADPARAFEVQQGLRERFGAVEVRGNTDERLGVPLGDVTEKRAMLEWLHAVLPEGAGAYVGALPLSARLANGQVFAAHGSPSSAWEYLLLDGNRWADDQTVRERLGDAASARVVVVGHSHLEHVRQLGETTVVNVGAVSRQKDGSPLARWVLLEQGGEAWSVTFKRVAYDVEAAARWAERYAYHGEKEARQLRTGRDQKD